MSLAFVQGDRQTEQDIVSPLTETLAAAFKLLKDSIFLKNRHFIIQERFNKLIYGIDTITKCGTWQPVKFQLVSHSWNEMIFYRIFELLLPTLIQRYDY